MIEKKIRIINKLGLHARAAAKFVKLANRFGSSVKIEKDGVVIDGKSILGILTLAAVQGTMIKLNISGKDEKATLKALVALIENKFDEEE
ncbi:MAG: HPr family phosphocarrier protein [Candidatus Aminicenantes bacterium]|jgi:phosphocarrier protein HPr|nr:HPr family phosphocarrier protein [Candidatus Aminicenantes bacterium]MDH5383344.1 HPr family phosphocarrier protein [Candidatus Aminicenantes bacterium]MDH5745117.1 HPr family phosphocarrier protein [Candidatus Aminicenantes bacterium]